MARRWRPPETERAIGLGFYATTTAPVPGVVKDRPDDFRVSEVPAYPTPAADGPYTVLRVRSQNWEQHELAERLGAALGLPRHAFSWAGTKDRRAIAERLFSYRGALPTPSVDLPGVEVLEAYRARNGLSLGHHYGNTFSIRIRSIVPAAEGRASLRAAVGELRAQGVLPDLFGPQRFGEVRPVTHLVGQALVRGDTEGAVELYLAGLPELSDPVGGEARRAYAASHDVRGALRAFPRAYRFERSILERLDRGSPPANAFRALTRELRLLFVHAVQSWMFNLWLTARVEADLSLVVPDPGDSILRVASDGTTPSRDAVLVSGDNLAECRDTIRKGRARLAGPLIGYATPRPEGPAGALYDRVLAESGTDPSGFRLPTFPELASAGAWRPATIPFPALGVRDEEPDAVVLDFSLPKGSYATVLLRELLKPGATPGAS